MTLLFGSVVIISSLFTAFMLCFFWRYRRALYRGIVLEYDETIGAYRGVPKMWELWAQGEPSGSQRDWGSVRVSRTTTGVPFVQVKAAENTQPLSVDLERAARVNPEASTSPACHSRRLLRNPFCSPDPPPEAHPPDDGPRPVAAAAPLNSLRMSFIIAMPRVDLPNRRYSVISQGPSVNGDWGNGEYAIGIYHAPFREESSL